MKEMKELQQNPVWVSCGTQEDGMWLVCSSLLRYEALRNKWLTCSCKEDLATASEKHLFPRGQPSLEMGTCCCVFLSCIRNESQAE